MSTDEDKSKLAKLLQGLEVPDIKLTERCSDLVKDFHEKYSKEVEEDEQIGDIMEDMHEENPYKVDMKLLEENERKLKKLLAESKRTIKKLNEGACAPTIDPMRPWRTHSSKERLLRINNELKHHYEKNSQSVTPLDDNAIKDLVQECEEEGRIAPPVATEQILTSIEDAKRNLPNFQYKKVENSTATAILPTAHIANPDEKPKTA